MELKDKTYYWVKSVTYYKTTGNLEEDLGGITIGYYDAEEWYVIASDEFFKTYNESIQMDHLETCIIPIEEIKKI